LPAASNDQTLDTHDIIIIITVGGGQMGLSLGHYLRRAKADFLILHREECLALRGAKAGIRSGCSCLRDIVRFPD
tara:strand:- start:479 stop:703 length:225 start_codon:yes stop_codon:yes gene_type:complete